MVDHHHIPHIYLDKILLTPMVHRPIHLSTGVAAASLDLLHWPHTILNLVNLSLAQAGEGQYMRI